MLAQGPFCIEFHVGKLQLNYLLVVRMALGTLLKLPDEALPADEPHEGRTAAQMEEIFFPAQISLGRDHSSPPPNIIFIKVVLKIK